MNGTLSGTHTTDQFGAVSIEPSRFASTLLSYFRQSHSTSLTIYSGAGVKALRL
jgi:hypothetical protein